MSDLRILQCADCRLLYSSLSHLKITTSAGQNSYCGISTTVLSEFLSLGACVCAICGATTALANFGLLNNRPHTSNGPGFLEMFCPTYKGQSFYVDKPSVADNNLITASCTGALLWAKQIIERLGVFGSDTLEAWYEYFSTGTPEHFFALMQSLPSCNEN